MSLEAGLLVDHYELLEEISRGQMGVVFRARDTRLDRMVALKFVPDRKVGGEGVASAILEEARAVAALDHPGLCQIFEIGRYEGYAFLAMALVQGRALSDVVRTRAIGLDEAIDYAIQIGEALHAVHLQRIVHRDVKSSNVVLSTDGRIKLVDFGLAQAPQAISPEEVSPDQSAGTIAYMSPERLMGQRFDHRCDIWGLGVLLYELLSGELPFQAKTAPAMMRAVLTDRPKPISGLRARVPWQLEQILDRSLARDVRGRYARIAAMVEDLKAVQESRGTGSTGIAAVGAAEGGPETTRILVVDDEPDLELLIRQRFRRRIRAGELDFTFVLGAKEGLAALDADPGLGVVMTDIQMPGMDGLAFLRELQREARDVKPLVVSAFGDLTNIRTAMNNGAFDFVTKPIDFEDLEATLEKAARALSMDRAAAEARRRLAAVEQEIDATRRLHESMAPLIPTPAGLDVFFKQGTASANGEFHDVLIPPDGSTVLVVGEVFGTGVAATLLAAVTRALIRMRISSGESPDTCFRAVGEFLAAERMNALEVSCTVAAIDADRTVLSYVVAGSNHPLLVLPTAEVQELEGATSHLGRRGTEFDMHSVPLVPGAAVFLYTSGVPNRRGADFTHFSLQRLCEVLAAGAGASSRSQVTAVMEAADAFAGGVPGDQGGVVLAATVLTG